MPGMFARASRLASLFALWFSGVGLVAMTAIIFWQVVARYLFNSSLIWAEELCRYLLLWQTFQNIGMSSAEASSRR